MRLAVIGGGIAGISCAEELCATAAPEDEIILIASSPYLKGVTNFKRIGRQMETFEVEEYPIREFLERHRVAGAARKITIVSGSVAAIDPVAHSITMASGEAVGYDRVCIATGATPKLVINHPLVIGLRDADTVAELSALLSTARRVGVLGNGGIALGLVAALGGAGPARGLPLVWAVKDSYIGNTFFDASLSRFFLEAAAGEAGLRLQQAGSAGNRVSLHAHAGHASVHGVPHGGHCDTAHCSAAAGGGYEEEGDGEGAVACCHGHVDAPLPLRQRGAGEEGDDEEEDVIELVPTYRPLPQRDTRRARRQAARQQPHGAAADAAAPAPAPPAGARASMEDDGDATHISAETDAVADDAALQSPSKRRRLGAGWGSGRAVRGPALGPAWTAALAAPAATNASDGRGGGGGITLETGVGLLGIAALPSFSGAEAAGAVVPPGWEGCDRVWLPAAAPGGSNACACVPPLAELLAAAGEGGRGPDGRPWPLLLLLTNGAVYGVDALVSATGVAPAVPLSMLPGLVPLPTEAVQAAVASPEGEAALLSRFYRGGAAGCGPFLTVGGGDGGLLVDPWMRTTGHPDVYAAGDVAAVTWPRWASCAASSPHPWFQMRTWGQARVAGAYAARCMLASPSLAASSSSSSPEAPGDMHYELFTHVTSFLGYKVVLLGLFNGQGLGPAYEAAIKAALTSIGPEAREDGGATHGRAGAGDVSLQVRIAPGQEYIKLVLWRGRVVGAILVGDTDLAETVENLALNGLLIPTAPDGLPVNLLDPEVDIEDYFD